MAKCNGRSRYTSPADSSAVIHEIEPPFALVNLHFQRPPFVTSSTKLTSIFLGYSYPLKPSPEQPIPVEYHGAVQEQYILIIKLYELGQVMGGDISYIHQCYFGVCAQ